MYQSYIEETTQLEFQLKSESNSSPERLVDIQSDLSRLEALKTRIDTADVTVRELGTSLKNSIETNSGSTGYVEIEEVQISNNDSKINK